MKTYDSERKELFDWLLTGIDEINKKMDTKYWKNGHYIGQDQDCPENLEEERLIREYDRRLLELKAKYGIA